MDRVLVKEVLIKFTFAAKVVVGARLEGNSPLQVVKARPLRMGQSFHGLDVVGRVCHGFCYSLSV
jgi:hypothetical protein